MQNNSPGVVLVGHRNGAVRAARQMGLRRHRIDTPGDIPDATHISESFHPDAVLATTEATVLPAAQLRAALGLPGLSVEAAHQCTDKLAMKRAIHAAGLRCAVYSGLDGAVDSKALTERLGLPIVVKTRRGSGGRGAQVVRDAAGLPATVSVPSIAESFLMGTEMSVESLVVDGEPVWVNCTEYVEPGWANIVPASLSSDTLASVIALNRQAIAALNVERGITHLEVFLTKDGPAFGELAARPPGGHIMQLIQHAYGFDPWAAALAIELGLPPVLQTTARQHAGVRFIHPGAGTVHAIRGLDEVRGLHSVTDLRCNLAVGDVISARQGTGQHNGFAMFAGDEAQVRHGLETMKNQLAIELELTPADDGRALRL